MDAKLVLCSHLSPPKSSKAVFYLEFTTLYSQTVYSYFSFSVLLVVTICGATLRFGIYSKKHLLVQQKWHSYYGAITLVIS